MSPDRLSTRGGDRLVVRFATHARQMAIGAGLSQAIPLLATPILTRLYVPEDFGSLSFFVGLTSALSVVATGRLELAIVVSGDEDEARRVVSLGLSWVVAAVVLGSALLVLFPSVTRSIAAAGLNDAIVWAVPTAVLAHGISQLGTGWLNRLREYGRIASSSVLFQAGAVFCAIGSALLGAGGNGLVLSRLAALGFSSVYVVYVARAGWYPRRRSSGDAVLLLKRFRQFPIFNVPNSLMTIGTRDLLVFVFSLLEAGPSAGFFSLARSATYLPVSFLSSSLSQVYYREASELLGSPELERLTARAFRLLAMFGAPAFSILAWFGPDAFAVVFGEPWREAGAFASILAPTGFLMLFSSWPERLFEAAGKQWVPLLVQTAALLLSGVLSVAVAAMGFGSQAVVAAYSISQCIGNLVYLGSAFRVAGFRVQRFGPSLTWAVSSITAVSAGAGALRLAVPEHLALLIALVGCLAYYLALLRWRARSEERGL